MRPRPGIAVLLFALALGVGCASNLDPDDPAYGSEQNSNEVLMEEEREWQERDANL